GPGQGREDRHAGIHWERGSATNGGHRRRAIGLQNFRYNANRVRETLLRWQYRQQRALGKIAMADLAPARAPKKLDLADAERRKVIMQHELFVMFADQRVDLLFVRRCPKCRYHQRLGFPAGEQRRTVSPW